MSSNFPATLDIDNVYRGDDFTLDLQYVNILTFNPDGTPATWVGIDMTGGSLLAQIRAGTNITATLLAVFTITNWVKATGSYTIGLPATTLASMDFSQSYFYDVQFTDSNGIVSTIIKGAFEVTDDVSHT